MHVYAQWIFGQTFKNLSFPHFLFDVFEIWINRAKQSMMRSILELFPWNFMKFLHWICCLFEDPQIHVYCWFSIKHHKVNTLLMRDRLTLFQFTCQIMVRTKTQYDATWYTQNMQVNIHLIGLFEFLRVILTYYMRG